MTVPVGRQFCSALDVGSMLLSGQQLNHLKSFILEKQALIHELTCGHRLYCGYCSNRHLFRCWLLDWWHIQWTLWLILIDIFTDWDFFFYIIFKGLMVYHLCVTVYNIILVYCRTTTTFSHTVHVYIWVKLQLRLDVAMLAWPLSTVSGQCRYCTSAVNHMNVLLCRDVAHIY